MGVFHWLVVFLVSLHGELVSIMSCNSCLSGIPITVTNGSRKGWDLEILPDRFVWSGAPEECWFQLSASYWWFPAVRLMVVTLPRHRRRLLSDMKIFWKYPYQNVITIGFANGSWRKEMHAALLGLVEEYFGEIINSTGPHQSVRGQCRNSLNKFSIKSTNLLVNKGFQNLRTQTVLTNNMWSRTTF